MACDQLIDFFDSQNSSATSGANTTQGQAFRMGGVAKTLCASKFRIKTVSNCGDPVNVNFNSKLYACAGTPGVDGVPTGAALATSNTLNFTEEITRLQDFIFDTPYELQANTNYCILLETFPIAERGGCCYEVSVPTHPGNYILNGVARASEDLEFYIYEDDGEWYVEINELESEAQHYITIITDEE